MPADVICGRTGSNEFAVTLTGGSGFDVETILRGALDAVGALTYRAELDLRAAARKGPGSIVAIELSIDTVSTDQRFIRRELPRALSANELEVHYQSIVTAQCNGIVVVEALLRWNHAIRGLFVPANRHRPRPSTGCWYRPKTGGGRAAGQAASR